MYRYKISLLDNSSKHYGPCEICGKYANDVYLQIEERQYKHPSGRQAWTHYNCRTLFGHKSCLEGCRREDVEKLG